MIGVSLKRSYVRGEGMREEDTPFPFYHRLSNVQLDVWTTLFKLKCDGFTAWEIRHMLEEDGCNYSPISIGRALSYFCETKYLTRHKETGCHNYVYSFDNLFYRIQSNS